jgi:hypothetical protein
MRGDYHAVESQAQYHIYIVTLFYARKWSKTLYLDYEYEVGGGPPNVMVLTVPAVIQPPGAGRRGCQEWRAQGQRREQDVRRTARRLRARGTLRCVSPPLGGSAA